MSTITADVDVDVPVRTAYEQWTQFESFPHYLSAVEDVTQIDDTLTHWVVNVGGARREFDARIVDQVPDDHITWRSVDEAHAGRVSFRPTDAGAHVELSMEWEPTGFVEKAGAALQLDGMAVKRDLLRFKEFIEERRTPTGAWRGEVHGGVTHPEAQGPAIPGAGATSPVTAEPTARRDTVRGDDPDLSV